MWPFKKKPTETYDHIKEIEETFRLMAEMKCDMGKVRQETHHPWCTNYLFMRDIYGHECEKCEYIKNNNAVKGSALSEYLKYC
jgi:hypothetical protein